MAGLLTQAADQMLVKHSDGDSICMLNDSGADLVAGQCVSLGANDQDICIASLIADCAQGEVGAFELDVPRVIWQGNYASAADCAVGDRLAMNASGVLEKANDGEFVAMPKADNPVGGAGGIVSETGAAANGDSHIMFARLTTVKGA